MIKLVYRLYMIVLLLIMPSIDENNFQIQEIDFQNGIDEDDA